MTKTYDIYCKKCKKVIGKIAILNSLSGERIKYLEENGLISARKRDDGEWGFECVNCGSYSIVAPGEVEKVIARSKLGRRTMNFLRKEVKNRKVKVVEKENSREVDGFEMRLI